MSTRAVFALFLISLIMGATGSSALDGFIENRGQIDGAVAFVATGTRAIVYLTPEALVLDLKLDPASRHGCVLWIRFDGANPSPMIEGRGRLSTRYNYFLGSDPADWQTDVRAFEEIAYRDLWPGVDLVFRLDGGTLHYDVDAASDIVADQVRFRYDGADRVVELAPGSARIETSVGNVIDDGAFSWERRTAVDPIRDDPDMLLFSTYLGGDDDEFGETLTVNDSEGIIVAGETFSSDFPTTPGAYMRYHQGISDAFVCELMPDGSDVVWCTFLGGTDDDAVYGLTLDEVERPVLTGQTYSTDFPTTIGAFDMIHNGWADVFVAKLNATGSALLWSTYLGGDERDKGSDIVLNEIGDVLVTGYTLSDDFPATPSGYDDSHNGGQDGFVAKLDADGSALAWCTYLGGTDSDASHAIALDSVGDIYVTGAATSADYPTTPGIFDETHNGSTDAFVTFLDASGSYLLWSTFLGGEGWEVAHDVAVGEDEHPIVVGSTGSADFPTTPGAHDEDPNGDVDVFVTKFDYTGEYQLWSTYLGGYENDSGLSLDLDSFDNPVVAGDTQSTDFPTTDGAYDESSDGSGDIFVSMFETFAGALVSSTVLGGIGADRDASVAMDGNDAAVVTGFTNGYDFPTTPGAFDETYNGGYEDAFVAKLELPPAPDPICDVFPETIDFGAIPMGESAEEIFTITNVGEGTLEGMVTIDCEFFDIIYGADEPYSLGPGESWEVLVHFEPTVPGEYDCTIETGNNICVDVTCTGEFLDEPICDVSTTEIDYGVIAVGDYYDTSFFFTNTGTGVLTGAVSESCDHYEIISGGGGYSLANGDTVTVVVRFEPATTGNHDCTIETGSNLCADVNCTGVGGPPISLVEWRGLTPNDETPFVCPGGDGSWLFISVRDDAGNPVESAAVYRRLTADCDLCQCAPFSALTDNEGEANLPLYAGLDASQGPQCCEVSVMVFADGDTVAWRGAHGSLTDSREWVSPDLDGSCIVGPADLDIFNSDFQTNACRSDFDCSGTVDLGDIAIFGDHFGHECVPVSGVDDGAASPPLVHALKQNRPNPFNPITHISFSIAEPGMVQLRIYDIAGRPVRTLVDRPLVAGAHGVTWDGRSDGGEPVASGVYFYKIAANDYAAVRKMVILK